MSTILRALDKKKSEQAGLAPNYFNKPPVSFKWKAALLASFVIIVSLLLIVIYLLSKPVQASKNAELTNLSIAVKEPEGDKPLPLVASHKESHVKKLSFELQPLPKLDSSPLVSVTQNNESIIQLDREQTQQLIIPVTEKPTQQVKVAMDYSDTPANLQLRFQQALLMDTEVDTVLHKQENGGASDIYQMSSEFQAQLPRFSYDSHVYSSIAQDRWIRINHEDLKEGQFDSSGKIQVLEIKPNQTVFRLGRQSFSVQSLVDWKGY